MQNVASKDKYKPRLPEVEKFAKHSSSDQKRLDSLGTDGDVPYTDSLMSSRHGEGDPLDKLE